MSQRNRLRASLRRKWRRASPAAAGGADTRGKGSLLRRAQQWLAARECLLAAWIARARVATARAHPSMAARPRRLHGSVRAATRLGGAGAIMVLQWWEYESPLKRRLALEATLRRLFSLVPETAAG